MPDFNKGDFTQQGVNGHVNTTVRLNEKRLVSIDLTSDEEAEGCTITGTVTDLLNDKVYGIGAGVSGNIEITENGENINVAPYATATVNVSGGGGIEGPFCILEIENTATEPEVYHISGVRLHDADFMCYDPDSGYYDYSILNDLSFSAQETKNIYTIPLPLMLDEEDPSTIVPAIAVRIIDNDISITDLVNCTVVTAEDQRCLQITDPTQYAHAKISLDLGK